MQEFEIDAPAEVRAEKRGARDHWIVCDASEIADFADSRTSADKKAMVSGGGFFGGFNWSQAIHAARYGSLDAVNKSDALLAEMAQYAPESTRRAYIDDVAGATPNVQAYLAGHPLNMRRRIQTRDEYAPLVIAYDPTCSATISTHDVTKRGIIVLALVRALAGLRPVELYVCGGLDWASRNGAWIACRIETAPLDLARAAHMMTHSGFIRAIFYKVLESSPTNATGAWPYDSYKLSINHFDKIARQAFPHAQDVLAIPGIINSDPLLANPRLWLARTMARLTGEQEAA